MKKSVGGTEIGLSSSKKSSNDVISSIDSWLADLDFADDTALITESREDLLELTNKLGDIAGKVGMRISHEKSKVMSIGIQTQNSNPINVNGQLIEDVSHYVYLGSVLTIDGGAESDEINRIRKAASVFRRMNNIWSNSSINLKIKLRLYNSIVLPTVLYASETWK